MSSRPARSFGLVLTLLCAAGCASNLPEFPNAPASAAQLLSGQLAFGEDIEPAPRADLLAMSDDMFEFIEREEILHTSIGYSRFRRLMKGLIVGGYFSNYYDADGTYSAAQTFAGARGNCLGYTNMFIALARASGLKASYQLIEESPLFDWEGGRLVRNNHINLILENVVLPGQHDAKVVVDFNVVQPDPEFAEPTRVSDEFAEALYYINLAVDAMRRGQYRASFAILKRAAWVDPTNKFVWNNLGVLYSTLGDSNSALRAYELALHYDPRDNSALAGMVVALSEQGRYQEAAVYESRVAWYQHQNPYYHYAVANEAFDDARYDEALAAIEEAIDLRGSDARFFALRAATAAELGKERLRARSVRLAEKYAREARRGTLANAKYYRKLGEG